MLNEGNFREKLLSMIDEPDTWSKTDYYHAFLEMTGRFLDELIAATDYENAILDHLGEDEGEALIEKIATSNEARSDMDEVNANLDTKEAVKNTLDFVECQFGLKIGINGVIYDDDDDDLPFTGFDDQE